MAGLAAASGRVRSAIARLQAPVRPLSAVPGTLRLALVIAFAGQLAWHAMAPERAARARPVPPPPPAAALELAALGEPTTLAAAGALWLQFHDEQPGVQVSWNDLDYTAVRQWLERFLQLAPASEYPLMLAVRIYGQVADRDRQAIMLDFTRDAFLEDPLRRWRWLAEAALVARHRMDEPRRALGYARLLTEHTRAGEVPHWARDLQIFLLEDLREYEAARVLVGGLLASGEIDDPHEIRFLERKLEALEAEERASGHSD